MTGVALGTLPWLGVLGFLLFAVRLPRPLPRPGAELPKRRRWPSVTVVVPARNEARNIPTLLSSLLASDYPDFEVVVVDDQSTDGTGRLARGMPRGNATALRVLEGRPVPQGWLGKPWACHQGAEAATGDLLLFTDADTWHGHGLLRRAVGGLEQDHADLLTVAGRQLMLTFWERLVQPQVLTGLLARYPDSRSPLPPERWRDAIANGQFILVPRNVYLTEGGHEALKAEVVEDLRMAQRFVRRGRRVSLRMAEDDFSTRMYASLGDLVEGWTKNIVPGGAATLPEGWRRRWMAPLALGMGVALWIAPPVALAAGALGGGPPWVVPWASTVVAVSAVTWMLVSWRFRVPPLFGLLYPLGAAVSAWIIYRSWRQRGRVQWKGRAYQLGDAPGGP